MEKITIKLPETPKVSFGTTETSKLRKDINLHVADKSNPHGVTAALLGLGNVDNTSDIGKPISTSTQEALDKKEDTVNKVTEINEIDATSKNYTSEIAVAKYVKGYMDTVNKRLGDLTAYNDEHKTSSLHITENERKNWNNKEDASNRIKTILDENGEIISNTDANGEQYYSAQAVNELIYKIVAPSLRLYTENAILNHKDDIIAHVTAAERNNWNDKYTKLESDSREKQTKDELDKKEDASNKSTAIDENSTDEQYPSSKAVKNYVDAGLSDAQELIDANTIVESAEGKVINITDSANAKIRGLSIYGKTTQADTPSFDNPQEFISAVKNNTQIVTEILSENLLPYPYAEKTLTRNGVTFTDNDDGSVTINGTATADATYSFVNFATTTRKLIKAGTYYWSVPELISGVTCQLYLYPDKVTSNYTTQQVANRTFVLNEDMYYGTYIKVASGTTVNNLTLHPMLKFGSEATPWKPFDKQSISLLIPNSLQGLPVTSVGNYTDENGQQYIGDVYDCEKKELTHNLKVINLADLTGYWQCKGVNSGGQGITSFWYFIDEIISTEAILCTTALQGDAGKIYGGLATGIGVTKNSAGRTYIVIGVETTCLEDITSTTNAINSFKTLLSESESKILVAVNPTIESLSMSDEEIAQYKALTTHKPVTNVFNDADAHIKIDYVADTKTHYENRIAKLEAAILSLGGNV